MESQPQNPEFRNNPENFHPCGAALSLCSFFFFFFFNINCIDKAVLRYTGYGTDPLKINCILFILVSARRDVH